MDNKSNIENRFTYKQFSKALPKICWIGIFFAFAFNGYGLAGKSGMAYLLALEILSFPLSLIFDFLFTSLGYEVGNNSLTLIPIIILFIVGYLQWFIFSPIIITEIKRLIKSKNN